MADAVPKIRVTDPQSPPPLERQTTAIKGDGPLAKTAAKLRSPTSAPSNERSDTRNGSSEGARQAPEAAIDPLSQQIMQRTNTSSRIPTLRTQADTVSQSPTNPKSPNDDTKQPTETSREVNGSGGTPKQEKKKGVSFLSRFIGTKRKGGLDDATENDSEAGESRAEGMDAQLFSHTADNLGFKPKHLQPPAYIKVRAKFKKEKEFNRVFLAQELRSSAEKPSSASVRGPQPSGKAAIHNPIWATEFSKDGRYLAAGGQDKVVRVWAVISSPEERRAHEKDESDPNATEATHLSAPVFQQKPFREYHGHTSTILDLSWSKNNFLLSSSMDKTVRLWHISRSENLCTFKHSDFVPSIQFHPRDDRFFLAGSLDCKLRLWSIPDKSVAFWAGLPDMITAVSFTPDGKTCIAGTLSGLCMFYETENLKYQTQIHVKSTRGQNAKGSKITGIQASYWPLGNHSGDVKILITSNDSRVRLYNMRDKSLEVKFRGHENNCSQIRAAFADDSGYIICGSEDRKAYIWSTCAAEGEKRNQRPMEIFDAHTSITTCAVLAPLKTRHLLSNSEDPIFDLCNPPPVTLVSRAESINSARAPDDKGSPQLTPAPSNDSTFRKVAESPAYIARSAHTDGNIIITADYTGAIKVFRQDCAHTKRIRANDPWETSSVFSSRKLGSIAGRPSSVISRTTGRTRRDSTSTQPPNDRIMSWRQEIGHGSFDSVNGTPKGRHTGRSVSPRKSMGQLSMASSIRPTPHDSPNIGPKDTGSTAQSERTGDPNLTATGSPKTSSSIDRQPPSTSSSGSAPESSAQQAQTQPRKPDSPRQKSNFDPVKTAESKPPSTNPLSIYNGQSWAFWNTASLRERIKANLPASSSLQAPEQRPGLHSEGSKGSVVSALTDELGSEETGDQDRIEDEKCKHCGCEKWKVRTVKGVGGKEERKVVCGRCGRSADP